MAEITKTKITETRTVEVAAVNLVLTVAEARALRKLTGRTGGMGLAAERIAAIFHGLEDTLQLMGFSPSYYDNKVTVKVTSAGGIRVEGE